MSGDDGADKTQPAHEIFLQKLKETTCPADFLFILNLIMETTVPKDHGKIIDEINTIRSKMTAKINNVAEATCDKLAAEEGEVPKLEEPGGDNGKLK